jgi:hypothetical protein
MPWTTSALDQMVRSIPVFWLTAAALLLGACGSSSGANDYGQTRQTMQAITGGQVESQYPAVGCLIDSSGTEPMHRYAHRARLSADCQALRLDGRVDVRHGTDVQSADRTRTAEDYRLRVRLSPRRGRGPRPSRESIRPNVCARSTDRAPVCAYFRCPSSFDQYCPASRPPHGLCSRRIRVQ